VTGPGCSEVADMPGVPGGRTIHRNEHPLASNPAAISSSCGAGCVAALPNETYRTEFGGRVLSHRIHGSVSCNNPPP
jgi:hypothetical protein